MRVYLAGPINDCTDSECKDWREWFKQSPGIEWVDPMRRDYRGREAECAKEIVELDKADIRDCDVVLVMLTKPSVGTSMEIFYAYTLDIPVIVIHANDATLSPWLIYHAKQFVSGLSDALAEIERQMP